MPKPYVADKSFSFVQCRSIWFRIVNSFALRWFRGRQNINYEKELKQTFQLMIFKSISYKLTHFFSRIRKFVIIIFFFFSFCVWILSIYRGITNTTNHTRTWIQYARTLLTHTHVFCTQTHTHSLHYLCVCVRVCACVCVFVDVCESVDWVL